MKSTIRNVYTVICSLVILVVAALGVTMMAGYSPKVLVSESMEPEVIRDSLVFVDTRTALGEVAVGDNVVFELEGIQILHKGRGVKSSGEYGSTATLIVSGIKGSDETVVDSSMYIGRQGITFPRLGKYILYIERDGMWIGISVAAVLIVIGCIPWKRKEQ